MRKVSLIKLLIVTGFTLVLSGCFFGEDDSGSAGVNIAGTWRATVRVENCSPADVCDDVGFEPGTTVTAVMVLRQDGTKVEGTYTYSGSGIEADVEGTIRDNHLVLKGDAKNPLGSATVDLVAFASESLIDAAVSHNVRVFDGRSGTVSGSGDFSK
ncbi:hypothetical protein L0222_18280 [bacterium]|nr:hypothetical protein [bacterium]MCI0605904.1 hypothetical protein [bacterium]